MRSSEETAAEDAGGVISTVPKKKRPGIPFVRPDGAHSAISRWLGPCTRCAAAAWYRADRTRLAAFALLAGVAQSAEGQRDAAFARMGIDQPRIHR
jgi:hypothetical protein